MSGHSKWSTIKHDKASTDAKRGQIFTKLAGQITIAVKEGGKIADPSVNFRLRLAVEKAKSVNMPKSNIERAIERGLDTFEGGLELSESKYEGFGPGGAAVLVSCVTDNKQRTASALKNIFSNYHGHLAGLGSVAYLFKQVGQITVSVQKTYDQMLEIAIDCNVLDVKQEDEDFLIYTDAKNLHQVKICLENKSVKISSYELIFKPEVLIEITDDQKVQLIKLLDHLHDNEDVHAVFTNVNL